MKRTSRQIIRDDDDDDALRRFYLLFRRDLVHPPSGCDQDVSGGRSSRGAPLRGAGCPGPLRRGVRARLPQSWSQALADATEAGGRPGASARGGPDLPLSAACSCSTPRIAGCSPSTTRGTKDYGLRKPVREHIARRMQQNAVFSSRATGYYDKLLNLWSMIDEGDPGHRPAALQRRAVRYGHCPAAGDGPPPRRAAGPDHLRPEPHRDGRPAPVHQLPRYVRPAARLDLRAPSWSASRSATTTATSPSGPIPTPARTAAASTRRRSWLT